MSVIVSCFSSTETAWNALFIEVSALWDSFANHRCSNALALTAGPGMFPCSYQNAGGDPAGSLAVGSTGFPASDTSLRFSAMMWTGSFTFIPSQVMAHRPYHMQTIRRRFRLERIYSLTVYHVHTIVVMFNNDTSTYGSEI